MHLASSNNFFRKFKELLSVLKQLNYLKKKLFGCMNSEKIISKFLDYLLSLNKVRACIWCKNLFKDELSYKNYNNKPLANSKFENSSLIYCLFLILFTLVTLSIGISSQKTSFADPLQEGILY